jgi:hypothetical protein
VGHPNGAQQIPRFAPPDFLQTLLALADLMRLSLRERRIRNRVRRSVAENPGRDDKKERAIEKERIVVEGRSSCWDGGDAVSIDNRALHLQQQPSLWNIFPNLIWTGLKFSRPSGTPFYQASSHLDLNNSEVQPCSSSKEYFRHLRHAVEPSGSTQAWEEEG